MEGSLVGSVEEYIVFFEGLIWWMEWVIGFGFGSGSLSELWNADSRLLSCFWRRLFFWKANTYLV